MRSEIYLSWAAETSLLCKSPCLLNLPTTDLEWSSSFSVPPCPLHAGPGLQSNYPRAGESANVQAAEKVPVRGPEAFFKKLFSSLVSAGADNTNPDSKWLGQIPIYRSPGFSGK